MSASKAKLVDTLDMCALAQVTRKLYKGTQNIQPYRIMAQRHIYRVCSNVGCI